ncbi:putative membrane protein [Glaesserella parasuis 12939]|nr:putative membrane protein [Glaesserella parasuis MN-H]EQA05943.1 putative membrane protein [Glaesserella parasuis 12939]EQA08032.1 putative membrane protein [Glaesserella parasuis H465]EQA12172.1 putative membrane protein [Glaesserella parasuis SW140]
MPIFQQSDLCKNVIYFSFLSWVRGLFADFMSLFFYYKK